MNDFLISVEPKLANIVPTAAQMSHGLPIPPVSLLPVLSADDWEQFTHEWLWFYKNDGTYHDANKYPGSGDMGLDLVAFTSDKNFDDTWDSFQCKHYDHALYPSDIYGEVAKIIYHSFKKAPPSIRKSACRESMFSFALTVSAFPLDDC